MEHFTADKKAAYRQIGDKNSSQLIFREENGTQGKGRKRKGEEGSEEKGKDGMVRVQGRLTDEG